MVLTSGNPDDRRKYLAVTNRDVSADGAFVYCVKTTKIYCRPTCKARLARRANVEFYDRPDQAEAAGYRACKRCCPQLDVFVPNTDLSIARLCTELDQLPIDAPVPTLEAMASRAGLTKFHFHRSFKKMTGLTPKEYVLARRADQCTGTPSTCLVQTPVMQDVANDADVILADLFPDETAHGMMLKSPSPLVSDEWVHDPDDDNLLSLDDTLGYLFADEATRGYI